MEIALGQPAKRSTIRRVDKISATEELRDLFDCLSPVEGMEDARIVTWDSFRLLANQLVGRGFYFAETHTKTIAL